MNNKEPGYVYMLTNPKLSRGLGKKWQEFTSCGWGKEKVKQKPMILN